MVWICPICKAPLTLKKLTWQCENNHCFDCAKEGYVNLLPAHQKRSKQPGDDAAMINARRLIHNARLYEPLAETIVEIITGTGRVKTLLDIGCGEGFYDAHLTDRHPDIAVYGIDIAKPAIKLAAAAYPGHHYAVAGSSHLPIETDSIDFALCVFAPINDEELIRVLRPGGYYLEVGPAPRHLWALREALYEEPREHSAKQRQILGTTLVSEGQCQYEQTLDNLMINALVMATPFAYRGQREKRASLLARDNMTLTMAFSWRLFQKPERRI